MGSAPSATIETEMATWDGVHHLNINTKLKSDNASKLRFARTLYVCYYVRKLEHEMVRQYFVTDKTTILEFSKEGACIHHEFPAQYTQEISLQRTSDVEKRIDEVLGATYFSWLLRNSEHFAKYIAGRGWTSMQCMDKCNLYEVFAPYLENRSHLKQLINTLPAELKPKTRMIQPMYRKERAFLNYTGSPAFVEAGDVEDALNIVMMGPTGSGKSQLINLICNRNVCQSSNSVHSVTKHMQLIQGEFMINNYVQKVNIIDTIGFCDTSMSQSDVEKLIKQYIKVTLIHINKVVIVCSGRLLPPHVQAIRNFLVWLKYGEHPYNFSTIYTKSEDATPEERDANLLGTCADLGIAACSQIYLTQPRSTHLPISWEKDLPIENQPCAVNLNTAVGFPPHAPYSEIKEDMSAMLNAIFAVPAARICVTSEQCVLL